MVLKCEKFLIVGHVQGVGFRYHTSHQGLKLGLTGYAKNLNSGDVEVIACGTEEQIAAISLMDMSGMILAQYASAKELDLQEESGLYILNIEFTNGQSLQKQIILK